jgi:hypothetical protein
VCFEGIIIANSERNGTFSVHLTQIIPPSVTIQDINQYYVEVPVLNFAQILIHHPILLHPKVCNHIIVRAILLL